MKRIAPFALAICVLLIVGLVVALQAYRFKKIEKRGPAELSPVAATIPTNEAAVSTAIRNTFNAWDDVASTNFAGTQKNKFPAGSKWSRLYLFRKGDPATSLFPRDEVILLDRGNDSFIPRYVAIPASLRKDDLYLYEPTGDEYWPSEYFYRGRPAKFRCSFFTHIEPAGDTATRVEIFEYQPEIWVGERFGLLAHAVLPGMFHDIRSVEPTTTDRLEVLSLILKSLVVQAR
jgi:hypothetical protein